MMKLMVTGIGAIGGYIASFLCAYYDDVTLIARGKRKAAIQQRGLILHSDYFGEHAARPAVTDDPSRCDVQDIIFVCVKNFSLRDALTAVLPCIGEDTIVVCMQNGVEHMDVARSIVTEGHVMDTTFYINAVSLPDYSTRQLGNFARLCISGTDGFYTKRLYEVLNHPGLKVGLAKDMQAEAWNKFITNCAINVLTAYYEASYEASFHKPHGREQLHTLLSEAAAVGRAKGVALADDIVEVIYNRVQTQRHHGATSSLARDIEHGRAGELDVFGGYIVREGEKLHVPVPLSRRFYEELCRRVGA